jgi:hypothetical protein
MRKIGMLVALATAGLVAGCQAGPKPMTGGPVDPSSVTVFTLALQPDSITGCILADPGMNRPMTLTVRDDRADLVTDGGIHNQLTRIRPDVYSGNFQTGAGIMLIEADLSGRPKRLTFATSQGGCKWAATA